MGSRQVTCLCHPQPFIETIEKPKAVVQEGETSSKKLKEVQIQSEHFEFDAAKIGIESELQRISDKLKVEDFDFLGVLGHGSFGKVKLVQHRAEQTVFALKTLRKQDLIKAKEVEHTKSERR